MTSYWVLSTKILCILKQHFAIDTENIEHVLVHFNLFNHNLYNNTYKSLLFKQIVTQPYKYAYPKQTKLRTVKYQVHFSNIKSILQIPSPFYKYQVHFTKRYEVNLANYVYSNLFNDRTNMAYLTNKLTC